MHCSVNQKGELISLISYNVSNVFGALFSTGMSSFHSFITEDSSWFVVRSLHLRLMAAVESAGSRKKVCLRVITPWERNISTLYTKLRLNTNQHNKKRDTLFSTVRNLNPKSEHDLICETGRTSPDVPAPWKVQKTASIACFCFFFATASFWVELFRQLYGPLELFITGVICIISPPLRMQSESAPGNQARELRD